MFLDKPRLFFLFLHHVALRRADAPTNQNHDDIKARQLKNDQDLSCFKCGFFVETTPKHAGKYKESIYKRKDLLEFPKP